MSYYCRNCSAQLNENGVCPNCGSVYSIPVAQPVPEEQRFVGENSNSTQSEQFTPVDLSNYYNAPQKNYTSTTEYSQQNYAPANEYSQQNYAPTNEYSQQNYATANEYPQQDYAPTNEYSQQDYAPTNEYPQQGAQREMPAIINEWIDCAVKFFTKEPQESVDAVMNSKNYLWAAFAGLNAIFAALCLSGIIGNGFNKLIETLFGSYTLMMNLVKGYTFGQLFVLFFVSLIAFAGLFFASSGVNYLFLTVVKKKAEFEDLLKVTAISFFPMTIACAVAFIFSFFLLPVSGVLLIAGFVASFMLLNESIKKIADDLPFWGMVITNIAHVVVTIIISYVTFIIAL